MNDIMSIAGRQNAMLIILNGSGFVYVNRKVYKNA